MNTSENILEFYKIKEKLAAYACTKKAKEQAMNLEPSVIENEVRGRLRETTEAKKMLEQCGNPPLTALDGMDELLEIASIGGCLMPEQLEKIAITLTAVRRMKDYLIRCKHLEIGLAYYEENLDSLDDIYEEISGKIRGGRVDDYASKQLKNLRDAIEKTDAKMHEKADAVMRSQKECVSDSFSTMRNGHICIPVKKDYKYKVPGTVVDKSSTGNTVFVEPAAVGKYYEELQELKIDEENEERRILYTLTVLLSDKEAIMEENYRTIEKLDFLFAKGKLSAEYEGIQPDINVERRIKLINGRHPLMEKDTNVPLNFEIGNGINGIIITGPNTGGKTVAIKTVALNCMMAQCGLHVPCEKADICMNNAFLCDIGDGQNLSENLSTFSAHITNVLHILRVVSQESLVIMDELGSGTDPAEGMGIAIAILDELKKSGALFLVTTHYPEVKEYALKEDGIVNARMTFDKESLKPMYHMVIGEAGESCAFYIAGKLGMPRYMLERAAEACYGAERGKEVKATSNAGRVNEKIAIHEILGDIPLAEELKKDTHLKIQKKKAVYQQKEALQFQQGDSVMVSPEEKIGIVCETADEKGMLRIQMPYGKITVSHKRVKLHVAAEQLYPEDYDFSIIFDTVEERKVRHDMSRKYVEKAFPITK